MIHPRAQKAIGLPSSRRRRTFSAETDALYQYQVTAFEPDGDDFTISLPDDAPAGMTIDDNGLITWTPSAADVGEYVINVQATDDQGAASTQGFLLSVSCQWTSQRSLRRRWTPPPAERIYRYSVRANDPDGDPIDYRLDEAPDGMTIDSIEDASSGKPSVNDTQPQDVTVTVTDDRGQSDSQSYTITMSPDTEAPNVSLSVVSGGRSFFGDATVDVGSTYTVQLTPTDNVGVTQSV